MAQGQKTIYFFNKTKSSDGNLKNKNKTVIRASTCFTNNAWRLFASVLVCPWWAGLWSWTTVRAEVTRRTWQSCSHSLTRRTPVACEGVIRYKKDSASLGHSKRLHQPLFLCFIRWIDLGCRVQTEPWGLLFCSSNRQCKADNQPHWWDLTLGRKYQLGTALAPLSPQLRRENKGV